jgi:protein ImuB
VPGPSPHSRIACLLVPDLPLTAELRAHPELVDQPLVVASGTDPRGEVVSVSPEAARLGVHTGASVAHARSVCAELCVRAASPALDRAARQALLDVALSFSPRAAAAPRGSGVFAREAAVQLDASGTAALFPSEAGFAAALGAHAHKLGLPAHVAIASSRSVALIAARRSARSGGGEMEVDIVPAGHEGRFLARQPIDILDPDDAVAESLTRFGIQTVGELVALPRRALTTRLGPPVAALIALANGESVDPPLPVPGDTRLEEAIDLEYPVEQLEPLLFVLQGLLSRLLDRLEARHLASGDLVLSLDLTGGGRDVRRIGVGAPTGDLRVLVRIATHALEARRPDAPVETVHLETEGRPVRSDQLDLFRPAGPAPTVLGRTLAELESLCGTGKVGAPRLADDHHPDAFDLDRFEPDRQPTPRSDRDKSGVKIHHDAPSFSGPLALRVLRPPVVAQVRLRGQQPEWVRSAVANGRVVRVAGPWRTTGGWWSSEGRFAFDSFDVQTSDGSVVRLRLDHVARRWQIDAIYD